MEWGIPKERILKGRTPMGRIATERIPKENISNGRIPQVKNPNGGMNLAKVEEDREVARSSYSSQTAREKNWGPVDCRNEYAYTHWGSGADWAYIDGS